MTNTKKIKALENRIRLGEESHLIEIEQMTECSKAIEELELQLQELIEYISKLPPIKLIDQEDDLDQEQSLLERDIKRKRRLFDSYESTIENSRQAILELKKDLLELHRQDLVAQLEVILVDYNKAKKELAEQGDKVNALLRKATAEYNVHSLYRYSSLGDRHHKPFTLSIQNGVLSHG